MFFIDLTNICQLGRKFALEHIESYKCAEREQERKNTDLNLSSLNSIFGLINILNLLVSQFLSLSYHLIHFCLSTPFTSNFRKEMPMINVTPTRVETNETQRVLLVCEAVGSPLPK